MRDINLLPAKYRDIKRKKRERAARLILVLAAVFFSGAALYLPLRLLRNMETQIASLEIEMEDMERVKEQKILLDELRSDIARREDIIARLKENSYTWSIILEDIRVRMPEGTALIQLDYSGKEEFLAIVGEASNHSSVAELVVNLRKIELFERVEPENIVEEEKGAYRFTVRCTLKDGSEPSEVK